VPRRSTRISIVNNITSTLTLQAKAGPCHGSWTDGWEPPNTILANTGGNLVNSWQSESSGIATGTEGWVKYLTDDQQLVYIHWDNPFVWADSTNPVDFTVNTSDVTPPCDADEGGGSQFPPGRGGAPTFELFPAGVRGGGLSGVTWWDALVNWPILLAFQVLGAADINLEFTLGLRERGSVRGTLRRFYDGSKGLRSVASDAGVTSLRTLFRM
jgi:hypothetical protein